MTVRPRRLFVLALVVLLACAAHGSGVAAQSSVAATPTGTICDVIPTTVGTPSPMATPEAPDIAPERFDLVLIDLMLTHHESGVAIAEIGRERGERPEVRALAEQILAAQTAEIAQLQTWRDQWYPNADPLPVDQAMAVMGARAAQMLDMTMAPMAGMDAGAELAALCHAAGPFDLAFLDLMLAHHQTAIDLANIGLENSTHPDLKTFELALIDARQKEIDQMREWRAAWAS